MKQPFFCRQIKSISTRTGLTETLVTTARMFFFSGTVDTFQRFDLHPAGF